MKKKKKKFHSLRETYMILIAKHHGLSIEVLNERERIIMKILRIFEKEIK